MHVSLKSFPAKILLCAIFAFTALKPAQAQPFWPYAYRLYFVPSGSMENTVQLGDRIIADAHIYEHRAPRNQEIAIFEAPDAALLSPVPGQHPVFIKRVVGVPQDVVYMINRQLFRNGKKVEEPYCDWDDNTAPSSFAPRYSYDMKIVNGIVYSREYLDEGEIGPWSRNGVAVAEAEQKKISLAKPGAVPANEFLMLDDHRSNSNDSHVFGFVSRGAFEARALLVCWPIMHWKVLN